MENAVKLSVLLEIYGKLLTDKQFILLEDYYNNDLSLSEIAENQGITRQAVRDNLKKGENNLLEYEEKLRLMEKKVMQNKKIEEIKSELNELEKSLNSNSKNKLTKIKKDLQELI